MSSNHHAFPPMGSLIISRLSVSEIKSISNNSLTELRSKLLSQKCFLTKYIKIKNDNLRGVANEVKKEIRIQTNLISRKQSLLTSLLAQENERTPSDGDNIRGLRKGRCCFVDQSSTNHMQDDSNSNKLSRTFNSRVCSNPCLPFSRHCKQHILYNVDQLLFSRCTAKNYETHAQCPTPTFDIERKEPLCPVHALEGYTEGSNSTENGKVSSQRKRNRNGMALLRPQRRKKKGKGKGIISSTANNESVSVENHAGQSKVLASDNSHPDSPLKDNSSLLPLPSYAASTNHHQSVNDIIPVGLDVLNPGDEALVACLVDDLPPLDAATSAALDHDLNEVLNKIQSEEEFNELFRDPVTTTGISGNSLPLVQSFPSVMSDPRISIGNDCLVQNNVSRNACYSFNPHTNNHVHNPIHRHPIQNSHFHSTQSTNSSSLQLNGHHNHHHPLPQNQPTADQQLNQLLANLPNPPSNHYLHSIRPNSIQLHSGVQQASVMMSSNMSNGNSSNSSEDLTGLATNIMDKLTAEQQQQLNELIDGALASGTLLDSPSSKISTPIGINAPFRSDSHQQSFHQYNVPQEMLSPPSVLQSNPNISNVIAPPVPSFSSEF